MFLFQDISGFRKNVAFRNHLIKKFKTFGEENE